METKRITKTVEVDLDLITDKTTLDSLILILNFISHASTDSWEIMLVPILADLILMTYQNLKNNCNVPPAQTLSGKELLIQSVKAMDELSMRLKLVLKDIENDTRTH